MPRFSIVLDLDMGQAKDGEERTANQIVKFLQLSTQKALSNAGVLINKVDVRELKTPARGSARGSGVGSGPGRRPVNRPKIEQWIRDNIVAGPSTQGTVGLEGVDKNGNPINMEAKNRIFIHRLAAPAPEGVGLSLLAIDKVLKELEIEGYLERGFSKGAPFYELIRPLEEEGQVGVRGKPIEDDDELED